MKIGFADALRLPYSCRPADRIGRTVTIGDAAQNGAGRHFHVHAALQGKLIMIRQIGIITGKEPAAEKIIHTIREGFADLSPNSGHQKTRTAYLIWRNPYMSVGGDTFIHDMLTLCGFQNVFAGQTRYPETSIEELASKNTTLILLSSEPYPFREQHIAEIRQSLPQVSIGLVDGEMFSWYGSRLQQAPAYFTSLLQKLAHHS